MRLSEGLRGRTKQYASAIIRCYLELLRDDCGIQGGPIDQLLRETDELLAIFTSMVAKLRKRGI
jgi:hypothetical protein